MSPEDETKNNLSFQDKLEIQELSACYANALDSGDLATWLSTWHDQGIWEGGLGKYDGKAALAKLPSALGARIQNKRHVMSNFVITGGGDQAEQTCYLTVFERESKAGIFATGVYHDKLKRVDGKWKFAHRLVKID